MTTWKLLQQFPVLRIDDLLRRVTHCCLTKRFVQAEHLSAHVVPKKQNY